MPGPFLTGPDHSAQWKRCFWHSGNWTCDLPIRGQPPPPLHHGCPICTQLRLWDINPKNHFYQLQLVLFICFVTEKPKLFYLCHKFSIWFSLTLSFLLFNHQLMELCSNHEPLCNAQQWLLSALIILFCLFMQNAIIFYPFPSWVK